MINSSIFAKACAEVLTILNHVPSEYYCKIPKDFINLLLDNLDETYIFTLETEKDFASQNLLPETIDLLAYIYRQFWCTQAQKNDFDKIMLENDKKFFEKYDVYNILKKRKEYSSQDNESI